MEANETRNLRVWFQAEREGTVASCAVVSAQPRYCASVVIGRPLLAIEKTGPPLVPVGDPGLQPDEADMALIVHHFTEIADRKGYFDLLRRGVRYPRPVFMVEWQYEESSIGPPITNRMPSESIMDEIGLLGFADVGAHSAKIPGQVIFIATDYVEYNEDGTLIQPTQ